MASTAVGATTDDEALPVPAGDGPTDLGPAAPTGPDAGGSGDGTVTPPGGAPATPFRLGNRPPLTGVRALGITAVLVYHANFSTWPGSWAMLQVFFVLSGFLITAMLSIEGKRTGKVSMKAFYARRAVRLLPPLFLTIGLLAIYGSLVHVSDASRRLWGDGAAALFYYADYRQALGHAPFFGYLAQSWSLSVE